MLPTMEELLARHAGEVAALQRKHRILDRLPGYPKAITLRRTGDVNVTYEIGDMPAAYALTKNFNVTSYALLRQGCTTIRRVSEITVDEVDAADEYLEFREGQPYLTITFEQRTVVSAQCKATLNFFGQVTTDDGTVERLRIAIVVHGLVMVPTRTDGRTSLGVDFHEARRINWYVNDTATDVNISLFWWNTDSFDYAMTENMGALRTYAQ